MFQVKELCSPLACLCVCFWNFCGLPLARWPAVMHGAESGRVRAEAETEAEAVAEAAAATELNFCLPCASTIFLYKFFIYLR